MLRDATPDIAWPVMLCLLPTPHMVSHSSYRPRWRDWQPGGQPEDISAAEQAWQAEAVTGRLLDDAGLDGQHWADLAERLPSLPTAQFDIEESRSQDIEQGIDIAIFNGRGVTWRGMNTGGQPERALADKYQAYAQRTGTLWPRTRRMLQRMAENWDRRARHEDQLAAVREEFWS